MKRRREKLLPWLIKLLDVGKVPGLYWTSKEYGEFRIPWKHAGKPDFDISLDAEVFRLWAINTGKYIPGQQSDPSTWKTRLRCALRKQPDIEEVAQRLDGNDPYRIFRVISIAKRRQGTNFNSPPTTPCDDVFQVSSSSDLFNETTSTHFCHLDQNYTFPSPHSSYVSSSSLSDDDIDNINPTLPRYFPDVTYMADYFSLEESFDVFDGDMTSNDLITETPSMQETTNVPNIDLGSQPFHGGREFYRDTAVLH